MSATLARPEDHMLGLASKADRLREAILSVREEATSSAARIDLAEAACRIDAAIELLGSARGYERCEARGRELQRVRIDSAPATEYETVLAAALHRFAGAAQ